MDCHSNMAYSSNDKATVTYRKPNFPRVSRKGVRHADRTAQSLYLDLKSAGILVRYFSKPRIDNCLRITVGSDPECEQLLDVLQKILA